ncbi:MAG: hypothetical protein HY908_31015 [Myxococcales bacterium]|nr:hypothetical protein [Myxococcales bacterium]
MDHRYWLGAATLMTLGLAASGCKGLENLDLRVFEIEPRMYEIDATTGAASPLPAPSAKRGLYVADAVGGKLVLVGGVDEQGYISDAVELFDPATDTWSRGTPWPASRDHFSWLPLGDHLCISGGIGSLDITDEIATADCYYPGDDHWETLPALPSAAVPTSFVHYQNALYVLGGHLGGDDVKLAYRLPDGGTTWEPLADLPAPCTGSHTAVAGDAAFVFGCDSTVKNELLRYDFAGDSWQTITSPTQIGDIGTFFAVHGDELVFLDNDPARSLRYDTVADTWTPTLVPGLDHAKFGYPLVRGDELYLLIISRATDGLTYLAVFEVWKYDFVADTWTELADNPPTEWQNIYAFDLAGRILAPAVVMTPILEISGSTQ